MKKSLLLALAWFCLGSPAMADPTTDDIHCYRRQCFGLQRLANGTIGRLEIDAWLGQRDLAEQFD